MFNLRDAETREVIDFMLNELKNNESFLDFARNPSEDRWCDVDDFNFCNICSGATKGVIVPYDYDFVIKFPFINSDNEYAIDYCKVEWANYVEAERQGMSKFFAKTEYYGDVCGLPAYIQEKAKCDDNVMSDEIAEIAYQQWLEDDFYYDEDEGAPRGRTLFFDRYYEGSSEYMYDYLLECWGEEVDDYQNFCDDNNINDVHSANIGYINGEIKVIDYSGYGLNYDWSTSHCQKILCA